MSEVISGKNVENEDSIIKTSNSTLTSENTSIESDPKPHQPIQVAKKKYFIDPLKTSRFVVVRGLYHVLRSIWIVAMVIGGIIAWIISMLFI